jgi:malate dehydrogenase
MVECIVKNKRRILPCAVALEGEYGMSDVVVGVPIKIGKNGMEQIIEIKLTDDESAALKRSADDVKANIEKLKTLSAASAN